MFGLEEQSNDKHPEDFEFDLESELTKKEYYMDLKQMVRDRMQEIKKILRSGDNKEEFDRLGTILHGYVSLVKVSDRVHNKK